MSETKKRTPLTLPAIGLALVALLLGAKPQEVLRQLGLGGGSTPKAPVSSPRPSVVPVRTETPASAPTLGIQGVPVPATLTDFFAQLHELDRSEAAPVRMRERVERQGPLLFEDLSRPEDLHPSYDAAFEVCKAMDPWDRDDTEVSPDQQRAFLQTVANSLPVRTALKLAGGDLESLRKVWFGAGRGFEHIFCGESGGKRGDPQPKLGGYHFWYVHYRYEREGKAWYDGSDYRKDQMQRGMADDGMVTGLFRLDVDGDGPRPSMDKRPRGGFAVKNSPGALLALGYVLARKKPESPVTANLTGKPYRWQYHMDYQDSESLRTLWPSY